MTAGGPVAGRLALCALFAAMAVAFVSLGRWQLDRAAQRRAVAAGFRNAVAEAPLTDVEAAVGADPAKLRYRRLRIDGRYDTDQQILLDNITHAGRVGYEVLTPFVPATGAPRVLVNRGWVPADPDRRTVPRVDVGGAPRTVSGRVDTLPKPALSLDGRPELVREGVYRVSFPTIPELARLLGTPLAPFELLLDPERPDGFARDWTPDTTRADRNTAYAGQWFIMAVGAAGLAVWAGLRAYRAGGIQSREQ